MKDRQAAHARWSPLLASYFGPDWTETVVVEAWVVTRVTCKGVSTCAASKFGPRLDRDGRRGGLGGHACDMQGGVHLCGVLIWRRLDRDGRRGGLGGHAAQRGRAARLRPARRAGAHAGPLNACLGALEPLRRACHLDVPCASRDGYGASNFTNGCWGVLHGSVCTCTTYHPACAVWPWVAPNGQPQVLGVRCVDKERTTPFY